MPVSENSIGLLPLYIVCGSIVWWKASKVRLASRISPLSDITLNDDDSSSVRSASGELKVWRTILGVGSRWRAWEIACWKSKLALSHYIILTSLLYRCQMTRKNPKIACSPRMHKQCVPGASPFFARVGDVAPWGYVIKLHMGVPGGTHNRDNLLST